MNIIKKGLVYGSFTLGAPFLWYKLGLYNEDDVRRGSFDAGKRTSQRFKKYPSWDKYAEPFIIKQSSILFTAGHSFLEGLASDNLDQSIKNDLKNMDKKIIDEVKRD